jgi:hypothetical protein
MRVNPTTASRRNVKKTCRWHVFSYDRSGYAARREPRGTGDAPRGGRGGGRSRAPPLRVLYECGNNLAARRVAAPYGFYMSTEIIWRAIRESPLRDLSKQEGRLGGETRCCPSQIASRLCRDKRAPQSAGDLEPRPYGVTGVRRGLTAMHVGATLAVAREGRGRDSSLRSE